MDPASRNPALGSYGSRPSVDFALSDDEFAFFHDDQSDGLRRPALASPRLLWAPTSSFMPSTSKENQKSRATLLNEHSSSGNGRSPLLPKRTAATDESKAPVFPRKLPQEWRNSTAAEADSRFGSHNCGDQLLAAEADSRLGSHDCGNPLPTRRRRRQLAPVMEDMGCLPQQLAFLRRSFSFNALRPSSAPMAFSDDLRNRSSASRKHQDFKINAQSDSCKCGTGSVRRPPLQAGPGTAAMDCQAGRPLRQWPVSDFVSGRFDEESHFCCRNAALAGRRMCSTTTQRPARLHPIDCQQPSSSAFPYMSSHHCLSCSNNNKGSSPQPDSRKRQPHKSSKAGTPDGAVSILAYHYGRPQRQVHSHDSATRKTFLPYRTNLIGC